MDSQEPGRVVIVGGGLAGLRVAERLRRLGHTGPVTLVAAETVAPYDRPPMSKALLTDDPAPEAPVPLRRGNDYTALDLDLRLGVRATRLDAERGAVELSDGTALEYDRLVIATGAQARSIPSLERAGRAFTLRTWDDCVALRSALQEASHVTIIGGGVLGCEIASSARLLGVDVDLVEGLAQPLARVLGAEMGKIVAELHAAQGVRLHCGTTVAALEGDRVVLEDGSSWDTDLLVVAVGASPDTEWLDGSGLDTTDGVLVDRTGATTLAGVFAAGDVARLPHPYADGTVRLEHWTSAGDLATTVAANLFTEPNARQELVEVPYFWSDQAGLKIQCLGLPDPDDDLVLVDGSFKERSFLALYTREGLVTGAVAIRRPGPLARCRAAVGDRKPLADVLAATPWAARTPVGSTPGGTS